MVFANKIKLQVLELEVLSDNLKYKQRSKRRGKHHKSGQKRLKLFSLRENMLRVREKATEEVATILLI